MEGISHEAISLAGHLGLGKLIVLFDDNSISIDGPTDMAVSDDQVARFKACGWNAVRIDGHDPQAIAAAMETAKRQADKPWMIACKTIIGYGAPKKQGTASTHGEPLGAEEIKGAREQLGWSAAPFDVPEPILSSWRAVGARGRSRARPGCSGWRKLEAKARSAFQDPADPAIMAEVSKAIAAAKTAFAADQAKRATRVWSQLTLEHLVPAMPGLIGGSADLTGSNGTRTKLHTPVKRGEFNGNYIHYGVREHGMAAAMNGLALHGGIIPYGGTFLVFTDYCRPSIRLSALMGQRVIYVMTHDSIGLGEDGPTHQPVEHLSALRAIPNLNVLRPADGVETAECWELALKAASRPSILALTRQAVPNLRTAPSDENSCAKGAYVLKDAGGKRGLTLIATGSEVGLAISAADAAHEGRHGGSGGLHAQLRIVPGAAGGLSQRGAGRRAAHRHRGGRTAELERMAAPRRCVRRLVGLRRLRAWTESLRALRADRRAYRGRSPQAGEALRRAARSASSRQIYSEESRRHRIVTMMSAARCRPPCRRERDQQARRSHEAGQDRSLACLVRGFARRVQRFADPSLGLLLRDA